MNSLFFSFLAVAVPIMMAAQIPSIPPVSFDNSKIAVQNTILVKMNDATISMMDVKKKMDLLFHQHYPNLMQSNQARCQFYEASWRRVLAEMIDNELILSDASDKEVKLTDGEVREEVESRFGPSVLATLDRIGVSYDEAWKMIKNDLLVRRMSWWFIQSKAIESVTPQEIRKAYGKYLEEHPHYQELTYRIISVRGENPEESARSIHLFLKEHGGSLESASDKLLEMDSSVQISPVYTASSREIAEAHQAVLASLSPGAYSAPFLQKSRTAQQIVARIFYLVGNIDHPAPVFQDLSPHLREDLIQKAVAKESQVYIEKLRNRYGFDASFFKNSYPEDMHPFSLQ